MQRLRRLSIENYRSIGDVPIVIDFPEKAPLILVGENNAGKSNIIRAIELMFGEYHPKFKTLEEIDHFQRVKTNNIFITASVSGLQGKLGRAGEFGCTGFVFRTEGRESHFEATQDDGNTNQYVKGELRDELTCTVVGADSNLSYQMSYATKWTLLSKVTRAFHEKLIEDPSRVSQLKDLFGQISGTFMAVPEFGNFHGSMSMIAGQMLANMSHALKFDFSAYDPSNYFKTLRVQPVEDDVVRTFDELGTGQQQVLALAFAHAYAKCFNNQGVIFVLDEPEAHLHPLAQRWLAKKMFEMASDGLQLVITTHSPYFINLDYLDGIYLVTKGDQTVVHHTTAAELADYCRKTGAVRANADTIVPFYSAHARPEILNGLFAKKVVLVEGPTEELALPYYLNAVGLDCLKEGIAIIGVDGKGSLAKWWRFFTSYSIPTYICFDNDGTSDDPSGTKRIDALTAIGVPSDKHTMCLGLTDCTVGKRVCVFGADFETSFRSLFSEYLSTEDGLKESFKLSKPILAREVAKRMCGQERIPDDDKGWEFLTDLAKAIQNL